MNIQKAIEHIISGDCILFTGAGFSFGTINLYGRSPLTGRDLTTQLYKACGIEENDNDLKNASQIYQETKGETRLIELLRKEYTIKEVTSDHELIASFPWKRIYTTNYDNAFELAATQVGKLMSPVTLGYRLNQYLDKRTLCVHLNGFINQLTPTTLRGEFKLTNTSYLTSDFLKSSWIDLFRHDIQNTRVVLFIGFSCDHDLDISRIISEYFKHDNILFITKKNESTLALRKMERLGQIYNIELSGLCQEIQNIQLNYEIPEKTFTEPQSFTKYSNDYINVTLRDKDVIDLLYKGIINDTLVHYSLMDTQKFPYYIRRKQLDEITEYIMNGGRNILIHSDLGNGKTLFVHGLSDELTQKGYDVYMFKKNFPNTDNEVESLCHAKPKVIIIIENYSQNIDLLKQLYLFRTPDTVVIVTERTIMNDTNYISLEKHLFVSPDTYLTKNLNILSEQEISRMIELFNYYGLWGDTAGYSDERKRQIFINNYKNSFRLCLLALLDSPDIKGRFDKLLLSIKDANYSFFEATLLILASNLFGFNLELDDLLNILDDELLENPAFYNNDKLLELIDFKNQKLLVRSSILAESLLVRSKFHDDLINLFKHVVLRLDNQLYDKNSYQIIKSIVSFSRLQTIFNLNENPAYKAVILNFFEEVKGTRYAQKNPHFWLQYAIARLSSRDYVIAKKYFDTAYSYAKNRPDFDTYQIDNHYARYLIENENINGSIDSCMEVFIQVHTILSNKNDANANRYYPLRVAINYGRFFDIYYNLLNKQDQAVFILSCKEILLRVEQYKKVTPEKSRNKNVQKCEDEMKRILQNENNE